MVAGIRAKNLEKIDYIIHNTFKINFENTELVSMRNYVRGTNEILILPK